MSEQFNTSLKSEQLTTLKQQMQKYYVDFDIAMGKGTGYFREIEKYTGENKEIFHFFKNLYEKNNFW